MPNSSNQGKDWIKEVYGQLTSRDGTLRVLDIGVGSGTYARLLRPLHRGHWTGIEVWPTYVEQYALPSLYDEILVTDVRHALDCLQPVDLVIAGDVLEHMPIMDAVLVVEALKKVTQYLVVSIPIIHWEQGAEGGNPYEAHLHHYTADEMDSLLTGIGPYNFLHRQLYPQIGVWVWAAESTSAATDYDREPKPETPDNTDSAWG